MVTFKTRYGVIQQAPLHPSPDVDCPYTNLQQANDLSSTSSNRQSASLTLSSCVP